MFPPSHLCRPRCHEGTHVGVHPHADPHAGKLAINATADSRRTKSCATEVVFEQN